METTEKAEIGQIVRFKIPSLHGPMTIAGTIKRILPSGAFEVKSQNHGYCIVKPSEIIPMNTGEKEQMETYIEQLRSANAGLAAESCAQQEALRQARIALAACFPYDDERLALKKAALAKIDALLAKATGK